MIAIQKNTNRILALGLNEAEHHSIGKIVANEGGDLNAVETDLDLWEAARDECFDVCILGQSEALPFPTLRIWLMRALQPYAKIIVFYDEIGSLETGPLEDCRQVEMIQRPVDPVCLENLLEDIKSLPIAEEDRTGFEVQRQFAEEAHAK